jgi:hypothetical protein
MMTISVALFIGAIFVAVLVGWGFCALMNMASTNDLPIGQTIPSPILGDSPLMGNDEEIEALR